MNNVAYFEIQADDCKRAVKFYSEAFGWKCTEQPGLPVEYWRIETDGIRGGILKRPVAPPGPMHGTNAYVCSIMVESFDKTAEKLMSLGAQVAMEKFAVPGVCWQGYFLDTEGNTFGIFQPDLEAK